MPLQEAEMLTPRESQIMQYEKEQAERSMHHELELKKLDLELATQEMEWTQLFKIPVTFISLPIRLVCALGLCIAYARGIEPSESFWKYLR